MMGYVGSEAMGSDVTGSDKMWSAVSHRLGVVVIA